MIKPMNLFDCDLLIPAMHLRMIKGSDDTRYFVNTHIMNDRTKHEIKPDVLIGTWMHPLNGTSKNWGVEREHEKW